MPLIWLKVLNLSFMPSTHYGTRLFYLYLVPSARETPTTAVFQLGDELLNCEFTFLGVAEGARDDDRDLLACLTVLPGNDVILCSNVVMEDSLGGMIV
jgi:hypothetical protein